MGLFLSSGIDSGVLLAIMSEYSARPVQAFTIGFEEGEKTDEVEDAAKMARRSGAKHYSMMLSYKDYAAYFERYMGDLEEPVADEPAPAFYFLAGIASQRVKVALTGQGADEPWAGYDRYLGVKLSTLYSRLPQMITGRVAPLHRQNSWAYGTYEARYCLVERARHIDKVCKDLFVFQR